MTCKANFLQCFHFLVAFVVCVVRVSMGGGQFFTEWVPRNDILQTTLGNILDMPSLWFPNTTTFQCCNQPRPKCHSHLQIDLVFLPRWVQRGCEHKSQQWGVSSLGEFGVTPHGVMCFSWNAPWILLYVYIVCNCDGRPFMPFLITIDWLILLFLLLIFFSLNNNISHIYYVWESYYNDYLLCIISVREILLRYYKILFETEQSVPWNKTIANFNVSTNYFNQFASHLWTNEQLHIVEREDKLVSSCILWACKWYVSEMRW